MGPCPPQTRMMSGQGIVTRELTHSAVAFDSLEEILNHADSQANYLPVNISIEIINIEEQIGQV